MDNPSHFDYIIIGAGAAGLMLADAMISDDFSYYTDFSIAAITKDSFFEDINKVSVNGIFYTSLTYKYFTLEYSANLTYDEQIYSHRQLEQTLVFGFTHTFNF